MSFKEMPSFNMGLKALTLGSVLFQQVYGISLEVQTTGGNASSSLLYGFMFEVCPTLGFKTVELISYKGHQSFGRWRNLWSNATE